MWLAAGLAAVLGGLAVVVAALAERDSTVAPSRVGPVTPHDLRTVRFPIVWRGYDPGHVDAMLARAAVALEDAEHYGAPADGGALPGFIAETFDSDEDTRRSGVPGGAERSEHARRSGVAGGAERSEHARRSGVAGGAERSEHARRSGEELEDGGGDGTGRLDG